MILIYKLFNREMRVITSILMLIDADRYNLYIKHTLTILECISLLSCIAQAHKTAYIDSASCCCDMKIFSNLKLATESVSRQKKETFRKFCFWFYAYDQTCKFRTKYLLTIFPQFFFVDLTISYLPWSVEVKMTTITVYDHLETFRNRFIIIEWQFRSNVIQKHWFIVRRVAREQEKLNRIICTRLKVLQIARAQFKLPRHDLVDKLHSHHKYHKEKFTLHVRLIWAFRSLFSPHRSLSFLAHYQIQFLCTLHTLFGLAGKQFSLEKENPSHIYEHKKCFPRCASRSNTFRFWFTE